MFKLPLFHDFDGVDCVVVGGGEIALRKVIWLIQANARVRIVAQSFVKEILELGDSVEMIESNFDPKYLLPETRLIISATGKEEISALLYNLANTQGLLINTVDDPRRCNVTFPGIVNREPVVVAVSTGGTAPVFARILRSWIEEILPLGLGRVATWIADRRAFIKTKFATVHERTRVWDAVLTRENVYDIATGRGDHARRAFEAVTNAEEPSGRVMLVGAGPGDPELITLKALRIIQTADVVLFDQLANPGLLEFARRDAEKIYVGKQGPRPNEPPSRPNNRSSQQQGINELLVKHAESGSRVCRLKGGDPFIYGRGGEEVEALVQAGIDVEVIPGITASLGAASYAGIPLTHRDTSQSVRFVTGHRVENSVNVDWPEFTKAGQTLVIYMGLVGLQRICERLIAHGAPAERPVALVENATLPEQRVLVGRLDSVADIAVREKVSGPTVVIIGEVVALKMQKQVTNS